LVSTYLGDQGIRMRKPASKGIGHGATVISGEADPDAASASPMDSNYRRQPADHQDDRRCIETSRRRAELNSLFCLVPNIGLLHQLLHRDRQVAHPLAGGMEHGIGDGSSSADYADFTNCLAAEGAGVKVRLTD
jgi:hypothetical protein